MEMEVAMSVHSVILRGRTKASPESVVRRVFKEFTVLSGTSLEEIKNRIRNRESLDKKIRDARDAAMRLLEKASRLNEGRIQDFLNCSKSELVAARAREEADEDFCSQVARLEYELTGGPVASPERWPVQEPEEPPHLWRGRLRYDRRPGKEDEVFAAMHAALGVKKEDVRGRKNYMEFVDARRIFAFLARTHLSMKDTATAEALNKSESLIDAGNADFFLLSDAKKDPRRVKLDRVCQQLGVDPQPLFIQDKKDKKE